MRTCHEPLYEEYRRPNGKDPPTELGCLARDDPKLEMPQEYLVIEEAVLVVVWSGIEVFNKKVDVLDKAVPEYKDRIDGLVKYIQRWRHYSLVALGGSQCWGGPTHDSERPCRSMSTISTKGLCHGITRRSSSRGPTNRPTCISTLPSRRSRHCLR